MQNELRQRMIQEVIDGKDAKEVVRASFTEDEPETEPEEDNEPEHRAKRFLEKQMSS